MSTDNQELRKFTAKTDGSAHNYKVNTYISFAPVHLKSELMSSYADQIIYCYDRVSQQNPFELNSGLNCLKKYSLSQNLA